jgi:hypothetical protein
MQRISGAILLTVLAAACSPAWAGVCSLTPHAPDWSDSPCVESSQCGIVLAVHACLPHSARDLACESTAGRLAVPNVCAADRRPGLSFGSDARLRARRAQRHVAASGLSVPEPTTIALLVLGGVGASLRRRRAWART